MNDITNTISNGSHRRSGSPVKVSFKDQLSSPTRSTQMLKDPPRLKQQESFQSCPSMGVPQRQLRQKRSRLDMLDQHLSSFPLAPPPIHDEKVTETLRSPDINAYDCPSSPNNSQIMEIDPIVLVEDYIEPRLARKKLSVSDLKASLKTFDTGNKQDTYLTRARSILDAHHHYKIQHAPPSSPPRQVSTSSSLLLTRMESTDDTSTEFYSAKSTQSTQSTTPQPPLAQFDFPYVGPTYATSITSSLPTLKLSDPFETSTTAEFSTTDTRLKSCVICETPLYDISSHVHEAEYQEFVCCNCTEKYEALSQLLEGFDRELSALHCIPEDVEDIEEALAQPAVKRQKVFSDTLVHGLKRQLVGEFAMDRKGMEWLVLAKRKLRWRWRISGLLPRFLKVGDQ